MCSKSNSSVEALARSLCFLKKVFPFEYCVCVRLGPVIEYDLGQINVLPKTTHQLREN